LEVFDPSINTHGVGRYNAADNRADGGLSAVGFCPLSSSVGVQSGSRLSDSPRSAGGDESMSRKTFSLVAGLIFLLVAVMHGLRLALRWEAVVNGWSVPMWVSAVALLIAAYLAFEALKPSMRS
jgi:hypothetical protein